jgi:toxin ParE1/3/4
LEASERTATRFLRAIKADFGRLLEFPLSGPTRSQLGPGLRAAFHRPYVIYYTPLPEMVVIIRVVHGARDAAAIAEGGGFD